MLVNNAAFQRTHDQIEEVPTEEFEQTFRTNVFAMFWLCRAALPRMQAGSAIINTASIQAFDPSPNLLAYAPTKGAIVNFTKALAPTAMKKGVRVNAVAPGPVWTPLIPSTMPEGQGEGLRQGHGVRTRGPAGRVGPAVRVPGEQRIAVRRQAKSTARREGRRRSKPTRDAARCATLRSLVALRIKAGFIEPMLLLRTDALPETRERWQYQLKVDGYRAIAFKAGGALHLRSRNDNDFAARYPGVLEGPGGAAGRDVIDGEVVAFDADGRPSFNALQNYASAATPSSSTSSTCWCSPAATCAARRSRRGASCSSARCCRSSTEPVRYLGDLDAACATSSPR